MRLLAAKAIDAAADIALLDPVPDSDLHANVGAHRRRAWAPARRRGGRIGVVRGALALVAIVALLLPATAAHAEGSHVIYFPWVSNNEVVGGQGPWFSQITMRNLTDDTCPVQVYVGGAGGWQKVSQMALAPHGTNMVGASTLSNQMPGFAVRMESVCDIVGNVKQTTPSVNRAPWSDGSDVVTGYSGLIQEEIDAATSTSTRAWNLPIVQTNTGWNTLIRVANLRSGGAITATLELYPGDNAAGSGGASVTVTQSIPVSTSWQFDAAGVLGDSDWVGYARITTTGASGVVARRVKPSTDMAITNVAVAADSAAQAAPFRQAAPLLFVEYNGWNTGINIANVSNRSTIVTVRYYAAGSSDGATRMESLIMPARSMRYLYTPDTGADAGFVGSATIESDAPVVASVDEVKYATGDALSYLVSGHGQQTAAIATVFKQDELLGRNDNSGINIANLDPTQAQIVTVYLQQASGADVLAEPLQVEIPAGGNAFVYLPQLAEVPAGVWLGALLTSSNTYGFVAISNDVNYVVPGDGAVVFSITGASGTYLVQAAQP